MNFSNFDARTRGSRVIPEERLRYLRALEQEVRRARAARKAARLADPGRKPTA